MGKHEILRRDDDVGGAMPAHLRGELCEDAKFGFLTPWSGLSFDACQHLEQRAERQLGVCISNRLITMSGNRLHASKRSIVREYDHASVQFTRERLGIGKLDCAAGGVADVRERGLSAQGVALQEFDPW
jgi:hypothetical protein